jgi:hypothetical protein
VFFDRPLRDERAAADGDPTAGQRARLKFAIVIAHLPLAMISTR